MCIFVFANACDCSVRTRKPSLRALVRSGSRDRTCFENTTFVELFLARLLSFALNGGTDLHTL